MRVIVTGASGFLGATILRKMAARGFDGVGVSRRDVSGLYRVSKYSEAPGGDCLVHCAETNERAAVNARGPSIEVEARHTLDALLTGKFKRVIYMSSAVVYGDRWMTPRKVSDPVAVVDAYTRIKLASERAVLDYGGTVVRLSNLYGPNMAATNVLSRVLSQLSCKEAITLNSLGATRDFLWVDDAAQAVCAIAEEKATGVFNVGTGRGTSIRDLVRIAKTVARSAQDVISLQEGDCSSHLVLDISDTVQSIRWRPRTDLEEGVRQLVNMQIKQKSS